MRIARNAKPLPSIRSSRTGALLAALCIVAALVAAAGAFASPSRHSAPARTAAGAGPVYGVAEDDGKYAEDRGASVAADLRALGMGEQRWTLLFDGNPSAISESAFLDRAVPTATAGGLQVVLSLFQKGAAAPDPAAFCQWAASVAARYRSIKKFIVGNEVNATRFWSPQHTAGDADAGPRSYYNVLSQCYDALKAVSPDIEVIGMGLAPRSVDANSTKPLDFIRAVGRIYRASGRTQPIMDALAVHPYPNPNARPQPAPDAAGYQDKGFYGIPQLDRVRQAAFDAFDGTGQPTTLGGLKLVIDEVGYQTATDGLPGYNGTETSPVVTDDQQAAYHSRIVALYACDPTVADVLFFHLTDEAQRNPDASSGGWQSGLKRPTGDHKPAYDAVKGAIAAGCTGAQVSWQPTATATTPGTTAAGTTTAGTTTGGGGPPSLTDAQIAALFEESLPAAAVDGPVGELTRLPSSVIPGISERVVSQIFAALVTGQQVEFDPGLAFWRSDLLTQANVLAQVSMVYLPLQSLDPRYASSSDIAVTLGRLAVFAKLFSSLANREITASAFWDSVCGNADLAKRFRLGFVCKGRSPALAGAKAPGTIVAASGTKRIAKGQPLALTLRRKAALAPGYYFVVMRVQSAANPKQVARFAFRPFVLTAADIAQANKAATKQPKAKKARRN